MKFTVVLEDINEKFATLLGGHKLLNDKLNRRYKGNKAEHQEIRNGLLLLKKDVFDLKKDLADHRGNTEVHTGTSKKKRTAS